MKIDMQTILILALLLILAFSANAQNKLPRDGFVYDNKPPNSVFLGGSSEQGFEDITILPGWITDNQSMPESISGWFQGNELVFNAESGSNTSYIAANFSNTAGTDICNWLIMPDLGFLQTLSFWSRTSVASQFPDRLLVLHSPTGATNTGNCLNGFGDFTETIVEINPTLSIGGYPEAWTQFNTKVDGPGRVAFVYFVEDITNNSNYIGIDNVQWVAGIPEADLVLNSSFSPKKNLQIGNTVTVNHFINNNGPGDATLVEVSINLPAGLDYVSNTCDAQSSGTSLTWTVGTLTNGNNSSCSLIVEISDYGQQLYQATVVGSENDLNPSNNTNQIYINGPIRIIPVLNVYGVILFIFILVIVGWFKLKAKLNYF